MSEKRVTLAAIAGAHGLGGEVRLKLFAESIASLKRHKTFESDGRTLTLLSVRETGKMPVARFAEIADRNAAEALRGTELTISRDALPPLEEGEYYHADLIGRSCVDENGDPAGVVVSVENFGAGDVIEIDGEDGTRFMVPITAVELGEDALTLDPDFLP